MKDKTEKLIGLEKVTKFLEIVFNSGNIKNEKPLSILIVAPVSNGKTTATKQFYSNKQIKVVTDATAYGILKKYEKDLREKKIRHIVIPDLLNLLARRKTSVDTMILFINSSSEDGISESSTYAYEVKERIEPFGWVMCVTEEAYNKKKNQLNQIGLSSRFLKVQYRYSLEIIEEIIQKIIREEKYNVPKLIIKEKQVKILGDEKIFQKARTFSKLLCNGKEAETIRIQKNLQTFLKASAYTRKATKVSEKDLEVLENLIDLIK